MKPPTDTAKTPSELEDTLRRVLAAKSEGAHRRAALESDYRQKTQELGALNQEGDMEATSIIATSRVMLEMHDAAVVGVAKSAEATAARLVEPTHELHRQVRALSAQNFEMASGIVRAQIAKLFPADLLRDVVNMSLLVRAEANRALALPSNNVAAVKDDEGALHLSSTTPEQVLKSYTALKAALQRETQRAEELREISSRV